MKKICIVILIVCTVSSVFCGYTFAASTKYTLTVNGIERFFLYEAPSGTAPTDGWPVIILLHGAALNSNQWYSCPWFDCGGKQFRETALGKGYFIIAPEAVEVIPPFDLLRWMTPDDYLSVIDDNVDLQFIEAILNLIGDENNPINNQNLNSARVYCTGFSNGATMTRLVAFIFPERIAAVSTNSACGCDIPQKIEKIDNVETYVDIPFPANHPPIKINHGSLDLICSSAGDNLYYLYCSNGLAETTWQTKPVGHKWLSALDNEVFSWFANH